MMDKRNAALSSVEILIEAVGSGSQVALQRLYEIESRRLYGIALRIVRRPEIAAEVLQETFLQIWQGPQPSLAGGAQAQRGSRASSAFARSTQSAKQAGRFRRTIPGSATRWSSRM